MSNRTANYAAFYVKEPFNASNLGAHATPDFVYYNQLKAWKSQDSSFPFIDAHDKTYNVRDDSSWETLKQRLHQRLNMSKNIILFLSKTTKNSDALSEEINYGINSEGLPIIVVYPDYREKSDIVQLNWIKPQVKELWNNIRGFKENMYKIATLHIPYKKDLLVSALRKKTFTVQSMTAPGAYYLPL